MAGELFILPNFPTLDQLQVSASNTDDVIKFKLIRVYKLQHNQTLDGIFEADDYLGGTSSAQWAWIELIL